MTKLTEERLQWQNRTKNTDYKISSGKNNWTSKKTTVISSRVQPGEERELDFHSCHKYYFRCSVFKKNDYEAYEETIRNSQIIRKEKLIEIVSEEAQILNLIHKDFVT